jgi:hypothetical protein
MKIAGTASRDDCDSRDEAGHDIRKCPARHNRRARVRKGDEPRSGEPSVAPSLRAGQFLSCRPERNRRLRQEPEVPKRSGGASASERSRRICAGAAMGPGGRPTRWLPHRGAHANDRRTCCRRDPSTTLRADLRRRSASLRTTSMGRGSCGRRAGSASRAWGSGAVPEPDASAFDRARRLGRRPQPRSGKPSVAPSLRAGQFLSRRTVPFMSS